MFSMSQRRIALAASLVAGCGRIGIRLLDLDAGSTAVEAGLVVGARDAEAQADDSGADASATCSPGGARCNGQVAQTCMPTGVWQDQMTCSDQACVGGACTGVCTPGAARCSVNGVETCDATGQWGAAMACVSTACVGGACVGVCTPDATRCS